MKKYLRFILKMLKLRCWWLYKSFNKKSKLQLRRVRDEWLQSNEKKEPLPKNFYIFSEHFGKDCFVRDLKANTIIVFLCAVTAAVS